MYMSPTPKPREGDQLYLLDATTEGLARQVQEADKPTWTSGELEALGDPRSI